VSVAALSGWIPSITMETLEAEAIVIQKDISTQATLVALTLG